jgi:FkbM family methyltransferase
MNQNKTNLGTWPDEALKTAFDLMRPLSNLNRVIIDVGAHRGETLLSIVGNNEHNAQYFGLEPDPDTFKAFKEKSENIEHRNLKISLLNSAAGPKDGRVRFSKAQESAVSGILKPVSGLLDRVPTGDHKIIEEIEVEQIAIDSLAERNNLKQIHLLKVDAEGYDLEVLRGAQVLLMKQEVEIIIAEVFFVPYREGQAYFWEIANYLHQLNYRFVNLYDTRNTQQGRLYTGNGIWVSPKVAELNNFL